MDAADVVAAVAVLACGAAAAALAVFVWTRRQGTAGTSLAVLLSALAVWNLAYGAELLAPDPAWRLRLGDLKYVGIGALTPAWLSFILSWTGRGARVTRRLLTLLAVEPLLLLLVLAVPATHDLVRYLPPDAPDPLSAEVATGPLFWVHLVYTDALLLPATAVFVASLLRRSRAYWLQAAALSAAALVPWVANLLFTLSVGPFGRVDLTPVAFTASGAVLAWGLFQQRLLRLNPLARSLLVDRMLDGVVVLDAYGRVTDANPAARQVLGGAGPLPGRRAGGRAAAGGASAAAPTGLPLGGRFYDVSDVALPGGPRSPAGRMLVLRDVTEREALERRLRTLLAEQHRVAGQLSSSLRPAALPVVPGLGLAGRFRPAGAGREIGGDFYDVVRVDGEWAFALGDVSGKGARAAATTAQARYTLRTLALAGDQPSTALRRLHALLAGELDDETYLTVVHGRVRVTPAGLCVRPRPGRPPAARRGPGVRAHRAGRGPRLGDRAVRRRRRRRDRPAARRGRRAGAVHRRRVGVADRRHDVRRRRPDRDPGPGRRRVGLGRAARRRRARRRALARRRRGPGRHRRARAAGGAGRRPARAALGAAAVCTGPYA